MALPHPKNHFKQALAERSSQLGAFLALADPYCAEIMGSTDFDWLLIDAEHGPNDLRSVLGQLQALAAYDINPVVRPADHSESMIKRFLDIGVQSLLVPMVESGDQAQALVDAIRYPVSGIRGVGAGMARAARWYAVDDYLANAEGELCLVLQIESVAGLEALDDIAAVDGVDGIFVGPADLAAALGYLGHPGHPVVVEAVEQALKKIAASGKAAGVFCGDPAQAERYRALGASFMLIGADSIMLRNAAQAQVERFRQSGRD